MGKEISKIRNIALIGHAGEGKTTLAEALLFNAGVIDRQGRVDDGTTVMDFDPEEIAKKSSISLAVASAEYGDYKFNLIDVPGFFDYEGEMYSALAAADSALIVTTAGGTLSVGTEKAIDYCVEHSKPCMIFVSGMDKENASFHKTSEAIRAKYPKLVASLFIPNYENEKLLGFVSVTSGNYYTIDGKREEMPPRLKEKYDRDFGELTEVAAGNDEELLDKYVEQGTLDMAEVEKGVNIGMKQCGCIPVLGGSGLKNQCVRYLKDKMISLLPSPADAEPQKAVDENGNEVVLKCDENAPTVIRVFKTIVDPFVGKLSIFKVISGTLTAGATLHNMGNDKDERFATLYFVRGKKQEPTTSVSAGDIGAVAKLDDVRTGDTLCGGNIRVKCPPIEKPAPVYSMAVYAAKKGEEDKIIAGLKKLRDEDPSFTVTKNSETGETILSGVGETQLAALCKKLKNKFGCETILKEPKIAYRETIRKKAEAEGRHKKQSGGAGQFGVCSVRFEPGAEDGIYEFVDAVVGGAVPKNFIPAVDKGLREAKNVGVLAGYPMVNLKCTLFDGQSHPVDSKEIAFISAAKLAYQAGIPLASPCLLEPVMTVEITVPDDYLGAVLGDISKRRGRILGTESANGKQIVTAEVPEAELAKYAVDLRSMTQGRGKFTSSLARYEEVPPVNAEKIIEAAKKNA